MFYCQLVLIAIVVAGSRGAEHSHFTGPFGHVHLQSSNPSPFNCNRSAVAFSRSINEWSLNVSSTRYSSGDQINVTWSPLASVCPDDFIGIYFPSTPSSSGACEYLDYAFIHVDQGNSSWSMINLRQQLQFRYYSRDENCEGQYTFVGQSSLIEPLNPNEPTQIHLAFADRIDEMFVSYVTNSNETFAECQYGLDNASLAFQVHGTSSTYRASDMCEGKANTVGPQAFIDPGFMHTVRLVDLRPSTVYYYRVGNDQHGWSSVHRFLTRPSADEDSTVTLLAYADMGVSPIQSGAQATIDRVLHEVISTNITSILHVGDLSYAKGTGSLWDSFLSRIEATACRVPYMVGIGNHEYDHLTGGDKDPSGAQGEGGFRPIWGDYGSDSGGECAVPAVQRFRCPSNGNGLFWYSFDIGSIHVVYYSTEHDFRRSSSQYAWLEKDLRSIDRRRTPWVIVASHRPMYSSVVRLDLISVMLRLHIEPLLHKYRVDLNLFGHIHSYERTCPMYQQRCVEGGVTHILIGMGGHDLTYGSYLDVPWSVFHDIQFGFTSISANRTQLTFTYYHTNEDQPVDQFQLRK